VSNFEQIAGSLNDNLHATLIGRPAKDAIPDHPGNAVEEPGTEGAVIQQIRPAMTADPPALVAAVERSQILLLGPAACARIPYQDDVDIAVLEWIASHARSVRPFTRRVI
jgi:hypothetical protein